MYVLLFLVLLPIGVLIELLKLNNYPPERSALYMRRICLRMPKYLVLQMMRMYNWNSQPFFALARKMW